MPTVFVTGSSDERSRLLSHQQPTRRTPYPLDQMSYRRRNVIERMFCKLKNWRRIATRYDRKAQNYLSGLALAAIICQWI